MKAARVVVLFLLLLGATATFFASERLWNAHQRVVLDEQLQSLASAQSFWLQGTVALSYERSVTQVALALETAIPATFKEVIDEQRRASDALLGDALAEIAGVTSFDASRFERQATAARDRIAKLRREADQMFEVAKGARNPERARDLPYQLKAYIEELYSGSYLLVLPGSSSSTQELAMNRLQRLAWEIREYGGRARTFYAIATLTQKPIPEILVGEAYIDTSRAKAAWTQLNTVAQSVALPDTLVSAIEAVEVPLVQRYFGALNALDTAFEEARAGGQMVLP